MSSNKKQKLFVYRPGDDTSIEPIFEIPDLYSLRGRKKDEKNPEHMFDSTPLTDANNKVILLLKSYLKNKCGTLSKILTFIKKPQNEFLVRIPSPGEWKNFLVRNECYHSEYNFDEEIQFLRNSLKAFSTKDSGDFSEDEVSRDRIANYLVTAKIAELAFHEHNFFVKNGFISREDAYDRMRKSVKDDKKQREEVKSKRKSRQPVIEIWRGKKTTMKIP